MTWVNVTGGRWVARNLANCEPRNSLIGRRGNLQEADWHFQKLDREA